MKFLFGLLLLAIMGWLLVNYLIRRLRAARGEAVPEPKGPRPITLVCIVLVVIYGVLILWRLHTEGWGALR